MNTLLLNCPIKSCVCTGQAAVLHLGAGCVTLMTGSSPVVVVLWIPIVSIFLILFLCVFFVSLVSYGTAVINRKLFVRVLPPAFCFA